MLITLNIDNTSYKSKPTDREAGQITDRLKQGAAIVALDPAELLEEIEAGRTFTPGQIGGSLEEIKATDENGRRLHKMRDFWINQQIIVADIDNSKEIYERDDAGNLKPVKDASGHVIKRRLDDPLTPEAAADACTASGLGYYAMYSTFSSAEDWQRFRVVFVLDEPLTDFDAAADFIQRIAGLFNRVTAPELFTAEAIQQRTANGWTLQRHAAETGAELCADLSIEPTKLIYGGRSGAILTAPGTITSKDKLLELPQELNKEYRLPVKRAESAQNGASGLDAENYAETRQAQNKAITGRYSALLQKLDFDKYNFDLGAYIEATTDSRQQGAHFIPCPICGHSRCLSVKGGAFHAFDANHETYGATTGTIIDYLMQKHGLTTAQALDKFKFEVMGYDRTEWLEAWKEDERQKEKGKVNISIDPEEWAAQIDGAALPDIMAEDPAQLPEPEAVAEDPEQKTQVQEVVIGNGQPKDDKHGRFLNVASYLDNGLFNADIDYMQQFADRKLMLHPDIDKHLTLYPGMAILGGSASLGKTTFAINIATKQLQRGEHVIFFSLEQTAAELVTKSLSQWIYNKNDDTSITNREIKNGFRSEEIAEARAEFAELAANFSIIECDFTVTADMITKTVSSYMLKHPGIKPFVIVDYLQTIAPPVDFRGGLREGIDENLKILKSYQKSKGIFLLLLSSFNRDGNYNPVSYENFKETGMIDNTCDYIFGLQLTIQDADNADFYEENKAGMRRRVQEAQTQIPKKIQFVSLKNRGGKQFFKANFDYYPQHDYFYPDFNTENAKAWKLKATSNGIINTPYLSDDLKARISEAYDKAEEDGRALAAAVATYAGIKDTKLKELVANSLTASYTLDRSGNKWYLIKKTTPRQITAAEVIGIEETEAY